MEGRWKNGSRGAGGKEVAEKTRKKKEKKEGAPLMAVAVGRRDSERMFHVKHFRMTGPDGASAGGQPDHWGAVLLQKRRGSACGGISERGNEKEKRGDAETERVLRNCGTAELRGRGAAGPLNRGRGCTTVFSFAKKRLW
ncbi:hypothetical protein CE91St32_15920 [Gordonibacter pamelaeae]|nr:hypothetical protein CE91St32_15920 [Gordonibacter pamelaeae]